MDRKSFLKHSIQGAAGLTLAPHILAGASQARQATAPGKGLIKKSLKIGMVKEDLSLEDKFRLLKDLGFDGVELDSPDELDDKEVLKARDKTGLEIPGLVNSLHWKMPLSDPDPSVRATCVDSMKAALRRCKALGGTTVLLVAGVANEKISYGDAYRRSQEEIRKILPVAEETGIKIAIENVWNNFILSPVEAARYIDEFEHPMIGWYFDVGNILRYGWPEHWIETLGNRILKVDIKEYSRQIMRDQGVWKGFQVELTEGDVDWAAVNRSLKSTGYSGWGSAEVPGGDRKRLEKISQLMDKLYQM